MNSIKQHWKSISWSILILALLLINKVPVEAPEISVSGLDKLVHLFLFFSLSFLLYLDSGKDGGIRRANVFVILAFPILYGGVLELMQAYLISGRSGDWFDLLADATGSVLCWVLIKKGRAQKRSASNNK